MKSCSLEIEKYFLVWVWGFGKMTT